MAPVQVAACVLIVGSVVFAEVGGRRKSAAVEAAEQQVVDAGSR
jgi:hypothetical protein